MKVKGCVVENKGEISTVKVFRSAACGEGCGKACSTCKAASELVFDVDNDGWKPRVGEWVVLESESEEVIKLAVVLYVIPLVTAGLAYFAANSFGVSEGMAALSAFFGLMVGFIPSMVINKKLEKRGEMAHKVVDIRKGEND